jgi:chromosome segregation ATPase
MSGHQEPPPTEATESLSDQLHMANQQLAAARAEVASLTEAAAQKDNLLHERDQQLVAAARQLEDARSEIISLTEDAARKLALLQDSQGEIACLIQKVSGRL